jgi:hypothetical protein
MQLAQGVVSRRNDADRLPFEHRKCGVAEIQDDVGMSLDASMSVSRKLPVMVAIAGLASE